MVKTHTTLSIDYEILEKAKARGFNISETLEIALKKKLFPSVKDASEEKLLLKCDNCPSVVKFGYLCEETGRVFCEGCEKSTEPTELGPRAKFPCRVLTTHAHLRIPGFNEENTETFKKIVNNQK